jgi:ribonucleoside-diphosphate reductase subunit M2
MTISSEGNFSVASLKEKFARAGRGKENATLIAGKKPLEQVEQKKDEEDEEEEPLLVENKKRFVLFPIKYHEVNSPPE